MLVGRRPSDVAIQSAKETKAGRVEVDNELPEINAVCYM